jgi:hypothetical protein
MTTFAKAWPGPSIAQQPVAQLPWGHITVLLDKIQAQKDKDWYAATAVEYGWSRNVLMNMIMNKTLERRSVATSGNQRAATGSVAVRQHPGTPAACFLRSCLGGASDGIRRLNVFTGR